MRPGGTAAGHTVSDLSFATADFWRSGVPSCNVKKPRRSWRDEVTDLKTDERTFSDYVAMLRRRRGVAAAIGLPIFLGFVVTAFVLPAVYEANALVQIQRPQIPESMVRTTVAAYAEEMLASVTQQVLTTSNVIGIIERFNLCIPTSVVRWRWTISPPNSRRTRSSCPRSRAQPARTDRNTEVTYAFTVGFRSDDPQVAADVANELAKLHTEANNAMRAERAAKTSAFLNVEAEEGPGADRGGGGQNRGLGWRIGWGACPESDDPRPRGSSRWIASSRRSTRACARLGSGAT